MSRRRARYGIEHDSTMIQDHGIVVRIYPDDNEGYRHQRFVVRLENGQTLLIVHNIDLVEKVPIMVDDYVEFKGEYEYNEKGGLVHWTHHDPQRIHEAGWVRHTGFEYS
ncbi:MAG: hypothetical protein CMJ35_02130 [Phycisphaerae bacterium]|nr:hypothetical protein [Phycisphaerae bacterium]MBM90397.1 hypothetical protein [Phycisphaerae bacterium]HCT46712.1 hypothetical protein [Phycisphaerales bacterium]|tara:strand:+ start:711 stop:1037 length:327 start_codon:yes stop_codon:yes gene_type:complete